LAADGPGTPAGQYGQVQALFDRGRLIAAHTSVQTGAGIGGSAAAGLSVDHPRARYWAAAVGEALRWHGGLTLGYFHTGGEPVFIECNPRTVEPASAAASGVSLPMLSIALAAGWPLPARLMIAATRRAWCRGLTITAALLTRPASAARIAGRTVAACSVTEQAIARVRGPDGAPLRRSPPG
jgi:biotin carboxylase